jgi:murein DD-endopeptidase MepM/ murein hydrolase activator NlpD
MRFPALLVLALSFALVSSSASADTVTRRVGSLSIVADDSRAWPGGYLVVRLRAARPLGSALAILDGRKVPFFSDGRGLRALVPLSVTATPGPAVLGIELRDRGRERIPVNVTIAPRSYASRREVIPEGRRALLVGPGRVRDGRLLLSVLKSLTPHAAWPSAFRDPVAATPEPTFGAPTTYEGGAPVERLTDAVWGEYHRGLDYPVPPGTSVEAPGAGTVLLAQTLALLGTTVVIDHGEGLVSVLAHLSRATVAAGRHVEQGEPIGLSGDTGIAGSPRVHWGTYLYAVAVDPRLLRRAPID